MELGWRRRGCLCGGAPSLSSSVLRRLLIVRLVEDIREGTNSARELCNTSAGE